VFSPTSQTGFAEAGSWWYCPPQTSPHCARLPAKGETFAVPGSANAFVGSFLRKLGRSCRLSQASGGEECYRSRITRWTCRGGRTTGFVAGQRSVMDPSGTGARHLTMPHMLLRESLKPFRASVSPFERTVVIRVCRSGLAGLCPAVPCPPGPPPPHWCPGHCCCSGGRCGMCHAWPAPGALRSPGDVFQLPSTTAPCAGLRHCSAPRPGDSRGGMARPSSPICRRRYGSERLCYRS